MAVLFSKKEGLCALALSGFGSTHASSAATHDLPTPGKPLMRMAAVGMAGDLEAGRNAPYDKGHIDV